MLFISQAYNVFHCGLQGCLEKSESFSTAFFLHPLLFSLQSVLFVFAINKDKLELSSLPYPLLAAAGIAFLLFSLSLLILKSRYKSAILTSFSFVLFFSYGRFYELWQNHYFLWPIMTFSWIVVSVWIWRCQKSLLKITRYLNALALLLVVISASEISVFKFKKVMEERERRELTQIELKRESNREERPNIYYIILDGYARADTLRNIYHYDNSSFITFLKNRGFYIAEKSQSNYAITSLSIASSLNMKYHDHLQNFSELYEMIEENKVVRFLKNHGYSYTHFNTVNGVLRSSRYEDRNVSCSDDHDLYRFLLFMYRMSPFIIFEHLFSPSFDFMRRGIRKSVLCTFSELGKIPYLERPQFVFVHLVSPHPPFVFDRDGRMNSNVKFRLKGNVWDHREDYLDQLIYITKKTMIVIDEILKREKVRPIIILQSDHGPAIRSDREPPDALFIQERMRNFNAYYLPESLEKLLYPSISPVNSFRFVFDHYFGAKRGLLKDEAYFSRYASPFVFQLASDPLYRRSK
ncbi:MAG: hypothetical protein HY391_06785 [Deltaproteobacteria bacterium]|nr:hypothetical protein [Deltaproteobacteria bacterium]